MLDLRKEFHHLVIEYFCEEYSLGRTPNPCTVCNKYIKFGLLLDKALEMGTDYLSTGHYARVEPSGDGYQLLKGVDKSKDQSYFLYRLGQRELARLIFPMGNHYKVEVRKLAAQMGLPTASRQSSQDICFIPDNDYRAFLTKCLHLEPGDIVDNSGRVLGKHQGLARYTIGQRHGLGLAADQPLYVMKLDATANRVVVSAKEQLFTTQLRASNLSWISGKAPERPAQVTARIRYQSAEVPAIITLENSEADIQFQQPQWAVAPGQAIVFYQGEVVLGGGIIER